MYNTNTSGTRYQTMQWDANNTVTANNYLTGTNSLRAPIFYDSNDTGHYLNPASTSRLNRIDVDIMYDRDNTSYYVRPGSTSLFNDARANIFYSRSNTGYYMDPESLSNVNNLNVQGTLQLNGSVNLGDDFTVGSLKTVAISTTIAASGTQARRFEIARISMDYNDWNGTGTFEVELHENYYGRGTVKKYQVFWGYSNAYQLRLVDANIYGNNHFRVVIGSPVTISGDIRYVPVYAEARYYTQCKAIIRTTRDVTYTDNTPNRSWAYINKSPGAQNISDFGTADRIIYKTEADLAADRFYDANNTSYYGDFGSTSYMNDLRANIFYERENTAYYFGSSQGDFRMRNGRMGSVTIENGSTLTSVNGNGRIYMGGNFHIDAYNGNDIYVNYYSNRRFRVWNGSSNESFRVDTDRIVYAYSQLRTPIVYDYNDTELLFMTHEVHLVSMRCVQRIDYTSVMNRIYIMVCTRKLVDLI